MSLATADAVENDERVDGDEPRNRRAQSRSAYDCVQLIAPYDDQKLPKQADFRHVVCRDISTSGISFIVPQALPAGRVIVALGMVPFSFLIAEIVRSEQTEDGEVYVGCRFVERLKS